MFTGGFEAFYAARRCQVDLSKPDDSDSEKQDWQQKPLVDNAHQDDDSQCSQSNLLCKQSKNINGKINKKINKRTDAQNVEKVSRKQIVHASDIFAKPIQNSTLSFGNVLEYNFLNV